MNDQKPPQNMVLSSFVLLAGEYIMLPLILHWDAGQFVFPLWMPLAIVNLFVQPLLIGSCIHSCFTQKLNYPYWLTLLLIVNTILYLLPILLICLVVFSDPIDWHF